MQVGNATVTVGGGTAILGLPDIKYSHELTTAGGVFPVSNQFTDSDDFIDEIGWNVNGAIAVPMGTNKTIVAKGFWSNIEDDDSFSCVRTGPLFCSFANIVDNPTIGQSLAADSGTLFTTNTEREVDHWGGALESQWTLAPGVMGVTQAPNRRYFALGADVRGIDQELAIDASLTLNGAPATGTYREDLDTRYYGAYAAWGGDLSPFLFKGLWGRWGLQSSFRLQGGIYHADTDYDGRYSANGVGAVFPDTSTLSLSDDDVAFIGGLTLETRKRIGERTTLSLKSEYEYYSYVPDMRYNNNDIGGGIPGTQVGTVISDDDAFSARMSLRLTIGLGPRELFQEPLK